MSANGENAFEGLCIFGGMNLTPELCYQALRSRDRRFDGRFFVGVTSTGIYCRPICRVRCPKPENCRFFAHQAAAEQAGFRPCLRCRPELAPGLAMVDTSHQLAHAAALLIEAGFLDHATPAALAARMGVSERHLRRILSAWLGVPISSFVRTRRLLLAKQLLTDTTLPVSEIALAAGFGSQRRFNALFQSHYHMSPMQLRRGGRHIVSAPVTLTLGYQGALNWTAMLAFFAARQLDGVEYVEGDTYRRTLAFETPGAGGLRRHEGWIVVGRMAPGALSVTLSPELAPVITRVLQAVRRLFDLDAPMALIDTHLGALTAVGSGIRIPGAVDGFEMAVRAIVGQQITSRARRILERLVMRFGTPLAQSSGQRLFPTPEILAAQTPEVLIALGLLRLRAEAIINVACAINSGSLVISPEEPVDDVMQRLLGIRGIGDWTAQYIALRGMSWPDAFPADDTVIKRCLGCTSAQQVRHHAERWSPWRAYAAIRLWLGNESGAACSDQWDESSKKGLNRELKS